MKTATIDIDGVLNNYPACWLDYISMHKKEVYATLAEAKMKLDPEEYKSIKHSYRTSGYKGTIPINSHAIAFTKSLKDMGYTIVIATSRPFHLYPGLKDLTYKWLKEGGIVFDHLEKKSPELLEKYPQIKFHIDDELDHTHFLLNAAIDVFIIRNKDVDYGNHLQYKSLKFVDSLGDVLTLIERNEVNL
ncbi:MAG TPA: hypothetical protein VGC65_10020 [Bacteroidia bacterium]